MRVTETRRGAAAALFALLVLAPAAPGAVAASVDDETFVVQSLSRSGDNLTLRVSSVSFPVMRATLSLLADGALVATPERSHSNWNAGETFNFTFTLLKDASLVTLRIHYTRWDSASYVESILLNVPSAGGGAVGPAVSVVDATVWRNTTANLTLSNLGDRVAENVLASVEDKTGTRIGTPYVTRVARVAPGETVTLSFELAKSASEVVVVLQYDGRTESTRLHLRGANGTGAPPTQTPPSGNVTLSTDLPFRDSEVGKTVEFGVRVQNDGPSRLVEFGVLRLPDGYDPRFTVQGNGVPSLFIPHGEMREVRLSITVPTSASKSVGESIPFEFVVKANGTQAAALSLSLTIRGQGKLEIGGDNWFAGLKPGEVKEVNVTVQNTGTAPLHEVRLEASRPTGWTVSFEPSRIPRLEAGEAATVMVRVKAPQDVGTGKYVLDIKASNYETSARARSLSVEVATPPSSSVGWIIGAAFAGLAAVAIVIKVRRR